MNDVEKLLRNSPESFDQVRKLSPTRFRFRVVNREGKDIRDVIDTAEHPNSGNTGNTENTGNTQAEQPSHDQWLANFQKLAASDLPGVAEVAELYSVG